MYTADPETPGSGLRDRRMQMPAGRCWAVRPASTTWCTSAVIPATSTRGRGDGRSGWRYDEVLAYFKKSEGLASSGDIVIDGEAHNTDGPLGVSVRSPVLGGAREFLRAAAAAGLPTGDYNGRDRGGPAGVASLVQSTTREGKRSSTYHAFLAGEAEARPNLRMITGAHVTRLLLDGTHGGLRATGVEYRDSEGATCVVEADREVVLSAGAIGSPQILMLSGIGPATNSSGLVSAVNWMPPMSAST